MTRSQKAIIFLNMLSTGLMSPILSLFLLSHGCNLSTLAVVLMLYSATVILFEVPSGIFADLYGRKRCFLLSYLFSALFAVLLVVAHSFPILIISILFYGLARAFSSGSLDSLIVEDCLERLGPGALSKVTSQLLVCNSLGVALGALLGGILPNWQNYSLHLLVRLGLQTVSVLLALCFCSDNRACVQERVTLRQHLGQMGQLFRSGQELSSVFCCLAGYAVALMMVEVYWQPQFSSLLQSDNNLFFGLLCAGGYAGTTAGSALTGKLRLVTPRRQWLAYLCFILTLAATLVLMVFQRQAAFFALAYMANMFALGMLNVPEQTIINRLATPDTRASILSCSSLFCQVGGIGGSAACSVLIPFLGIGGVWLSAAALILLVAGVVTGRLRQVLAA